MDKQQALDLINEYVEGWKHNDVERVLATLAPDCEIIESHGASYHQREHVRQWITHWFQDGGSIQRWDVTSFVYDDGTAAFEWTFECSGKWGTAVFDGSSVVKFGDGLIRYLREYRCTETPYLWSPPENSETESL